MTRAPGIGNRRVTAFASGKATALILFALLLSGRAEAQQFDYAAVLAYPGHINCPVNAGGIVWQCNTKYCTTRGPWPVPGVKSCNALAAIVGQLASYGYKGRMLSANDMAACNGKQASAANQAPANSQGQPGQQSQPANQSAAAINPLGALFQNLPNSNGGNSGNGNSNNSASNSNASGGSSGSSTPAPSASTTGAISVRTAALTVTGTGALAATGSGAVTIHTKSLRVTGTGALAPSTASGPISIRARTLSVTGTGSL